MFQKATNKSVRMLESTLAAIQNKYYDVYKDIEEDEWERINITIRSHFRQYDSKIDKDSTVPNVVKSIRRVLPPPAAPIVIEPENDQKLASSQVPSSQVPAAEDEQPR